MFLVLFLFVRRVFAKSDIPPIGHFLSIFGSVHDYRGSTFVCKEYDDGFSQCLYSYPLPLLMLDVGSLTRLIIRATSPLRLFLPRSL